MSEIISIFLAILLVVSNLAWLYFFKLHLEAERSERWQLQERIRVPEAEHIPIGELIEKAKGVDKPAPADPVFSEKDEDEDEFNLVGRIDPPLSRKEDESGD